MIRKIMDWDECQCGAPIVTCRYEGLCKRDTHDLTKYRMVVFISGSCVYCSTYRIFTRVYTYKRALFMPDEHLSTDGINCIGFNNEQLRVMHTSIGYVLGYLAV